MLAYDNYLWTDQHGPTHVLRISWNSYKDYVIKMNVDKFQSNPYQSNDVRNLLQSSSRIEIRKIGIEARPKKYSIRKESKKNKVNHCPVCKIKFSNQNLLIQHLLHHIPKNDIDHETELEKNKNYICNSCSSEYSKKRDLIIHLKSKHTDLFTLKKVTTSKRIRRKHTLQDYEEILVDDGKKGSIDSLKKFKKTSECPHCKTSFSMKKNLLKHMKVIHNITDHEISLEEHKPKIGHRCSECYKVFSLRKNLYQHLRKIHGKTDVGRKSLNSGDSVRLICDACGVGFSEKKSLMRHLRIKHAIKLGREKKTVAVCIHCNSTFAHKKSLYKHERKFHGAEYKKVLKENINGEKKTKERLEKPGNIDNYPCLKDILPDRSDYRLTQFAWLGENNHSNISNWFKAKLNFFCTSKEEVKEWKENYEMLNKLCLRVLSFPRPRTAGVLYKGRFRCHHNTMPKKGAKPNAKHTACSAVLSITLLQSEQNGEESNPVQMKALVFLKNTHNHIIGDPASLRYRKPILEVKEKFLKLFEEKKTVPQALAIHKADLESEYGPEKFQSIVNDRAFMPDARWAYGLFYSCYKRKRDDSLSQETVSPDIGSPHSEYISIPNIDSNTVPTHNQDPYKMLTDGLQNICREICERCESSPSYYYSGIQNFISFYENNCKTDAQLLTFLQSFGKCVNVSNKPRTFQKNMVSLNGTDFPNDSSTMMTSTSLNPFVKYNTIGTYSKPRLPHHRNTMVPATAMTNAEIMSSTVSSIAVHETHNGMEARPIYAIETNKYDDCILYPIENRQNVAPNCWLPNEYSMF